MKLKHDFEEERKLNVVKFMSIRSKLSESQKKICYDSNGWNFSFENDPTCKNEDNNMQALSSFFEDVVIDCSTFTVDIYSDRSPLIAANLSSLQTHDSRLIGSVRAKTAQETNVSFEFKIRGDKNGIGLNDTDDGYAQCEFSVSLDSKEDKQVRAILKTDIVHVKFAKDSKKISSMKFSNIADGTASFSPAKLHDAEFGQVSFPSVVSLEQTL